VSCDERKLECLSRNCCHHLLKTFWNGVTEWRDRQLPDGTVVWTSPTGNRGVMMPKRRHTRADDKAKAVAAERRLNDALVAEHNKPPAF
jgi:hypothetical protein